MNLGGVVNPGSYTFWTGIAMVGFGIFQIVTKDVDSGIRSIMEGAGLIFLRRAIAQVK